MPEAMLEAHALLETVFSNTHIMGAYLDTSFRIVRVNKAFSTFEEEPPEFFTGKDYFRLYPDPEKEFVFRNLLKQREPHFAEERPFFSALHPERGPTYWDWSAHPVVGSGGRLYGIILCMLDRTHKKKVQDELLKSEQRFHAVFDSSLDAILLVDNHGVFVDINPAACTLFDMHRDCVIGKHLTDFLESDTDFDTAWQNFLQEQSRKGDARVKRANGAVKEVEYAATANFLPGQHLGVLRDITQRKQMETALQKSERQLRSLSARLLSVQEEEKHRLARELHDNIGQVLAAIKFGVENALRAVSRGNADVAAVALENLVPAIQDSIQEVRRMFTALRPTILDDVGILAALGGLVREILAACPQLQIETHVALDERDVPIDSRTAIFRIVQEALKNACRHSEASRVTIRFAKSDHSLELTIADNGLGFDLEQTLSAGDLDNEFGLFSMQEFAEVSGGTFRADSSKGKGTTILATWPCAVQ